MAYPCIAPRWSACRISKSSVPWSRTGWADFPIWTSYDDLGIVWRGSHRLSRAGLDARVSTRWKSAFQSSCHEVQQILAVSSHLAQPGVITSHLAQLENGGAEKLVVVGIRKMLERDRNGLLITSEPRQQSDQHLGRHFRHVVGA